MNFGDDSRLWSSEATCPETANCTSVASMAGDPCSRWSSSMSRFMSTSCVSTYRHLPAFLRRRASALLPPRPCSAHLLPPSPASIPVSHRWLEVKPLLPLRLLLQVFFLFFFWQLFSMNTMFCLLAWHILVLYEILEKFLQLYFFGSGCNFTCVNKTSSSYLFIYLEKMHIALLRLLNPSQSSTTMTTFLYIYFEGILGLV